MITPERLSAWRIFPRLLITLYGVAFWRTTEWFMQLPDPTNAQSAFVSVIVLSDRIIPPFVFSLAL